MEMDATETLAEVEAAVAAAAEMEERAEAWVEGALEVEVEQPEVPQGCGCTTLRIYLTCPFGTGKRVEYPGKDGPPHSPGSRSLQKLAPV